MNLKKMINLLIIFIFVINTAFALDINLKNNHLSPRTIMKNGNVLLFIQPPAKPSPDMRENKLIITHDQLPFWGDFIENPDDYPVIIEAFRSADESLRKEGRNISLLELINQPKLVINGIMNLANYSDEVASYWMAQIIYIQAIVKQLDEDHPSKISAVTFFSGGLIAALFATGASNYEAVPIAIDFYSEYLKSSLELGQKHSIYAASFKTNDYQRKVKTAFNKLKQSSLRSFSKNDKIIVKKTLDAVYQRIIDFFDKGKTTKNFQFDDFLNPLKSYFDFKSKEFQVFYKSIKETEKYAEQKLENIHTLIKKIKAELETQQAKQKKIWIKEIRHDRVFIAGDIKDLYEYLLEKNKKERRMKYSKNKNIITLVRYYFSTFLLQMKHYIFKIGFLSMRDTIDSLITKLNSYGLSTLSFFLKTIYIGVFVKYICPVSLVPLLQAEHLPVLWNESPRLQDIVNEIINKNYVSSPKWPIFNTGVGHLIPKNPFKKEPFSSEEVLLFFKSGLYNEIDLVTGFSDAFKYSGNIEHVVSISPSKRFYTSLKMGALTTTLHVKKQPEIDEDLIQRMFVSIKRPEKPSKLKLRFFHEAA